MTSDTVDETSRIARMTADEHAAHVEGMKRKTGHDGMAPRSQRPKTNVRDLVMSLG